MAYIGISKTYNYYYLATLAGQTNSRKNLAFKKVQLENVRLVFPKILTLNTKIMRPQEAPDRAKLMEFGYIIKDQLIQSELCQDSNLPKSIIFPYQIENLRGLF